MDERLVRALEYAVYGQTDGEHHKAWAIDQMVRAVTGCPIIEDTSLDYKGEQYTFERQGESAEYLEWVRAYCDGEDGPETYRWDEGIAP